MKLPSAYVVALATVLNVTRYSAELSKKVTRFRMSRQSLCKISKRQRLRSAFIEEYEEHLDILGWTMIEMADGGYAFIEASSMTSWTKISSKRVARDITSVMKGAKSEEELEQEIEFSLDEEEDGDE